jgi:hypothetical protein
LAFLRLSVEKVPLGGELLGTRLAVNAGAMVGTAR